MNEGWSGESRQNGSRYRAGRFAGLSGRGCGGVEVDEKVLLQSREYVEAELLRRERSPARERLLVLTLEYADLVGCDLAIEAAPESLELN